MDTISINIFVNIIEKTEKACLILSLLLILHIGTHILSENSKDTTNRKPTQIT
jgi:hypothetical protein